MIHVSVLCDRDTLNLHLYFFTDAHCCQFTVAEYSQHIRIFNIRGIRYPTNQDSLINTYDALKSRHLSRSKKMLYLLWIITDGRRTATWFLLFCLSKIILIIKGTCEKTLKRLFFSRGMTLNIYNTFWHSSYKMPMAFPPLYSNLFFSKKKSRCWKSKACSSFVIKYTVIREVVSHRLRYLDICINIIPIDY